MQVFQNTILAKCCSDRDDRVRDLVRDLVRDHDLAHVHDGIVVHADGLVTLL